MKTSNYVLSVRLVAFCQFRKRIGTTALCSTALIIGTIVSFAKSFSLGAPLLAFGILLACTITIFSVLYAKIPNWRTEVRDWLKFYSDGAGFVFVVIAAFLFALTTAAYFFPEMDKGVSHELFGVISFFYWVAITLGLLIAIKIEKQSKRAIRQAAEEKELDSLREQVQKIHESKVTLT